MLTQRGRVRQQKNESLMGLLLRMRSLSIVDRALVQAIEATPRDRFVPAHYIDQPYLSRSVPIECGQSMSGVDQVVRTIHAMKLAPSHTVLEVGTGTGYQAALIARLSKKVLTLDRYATLCSQAKERMELLAIENCIIRQVDGLADLSELRLYDRIVANGVFSGQPKQFLDHLASGGAMIVAIGEPLGEQMLVRLTKIGSRFEREDLFPVRLAPFQPGIAEFL
jgi:protein-L-isoaspartate(D-aspartate) O-methyltransferase